MKVYKYIRLIKCRNEIEGTVEEYRWVYRYRTGYNWSRLPTPTMAELFNNKYAIAPFLKKGGWKWI